MTPLLPPIVHSNRGSLPVVLSVPHSGRDYPDWLLAMARGGPAALTSLEDPLVDRLVWRAMQLGVAAVISRAPRAAIDCNRSEDEVDPAVIEGVCVGAMSVRARGGLGIVPSRTQKHGPLWRRPISRSELAQRIEQAHRPYHLALEEQLDQTVRRFGCALLLDCHSMPPVPDGVPPIIIGDRFGRSAAPWLGAEAMRVASGLGFGCTMNDPFAGGYVIARHSMPGRSVHALQIEVDRRSYMDPALSDAGDGFDAVSRLFERLACDLGTMLRSEPLATAAE